MENVDKMIARRQRESLITLGLFFAVATIFLGMGYYIGTERATAEIRFELLPC